MPSLYDLTNKDIASIMKDMGYSDEDIKKYSGYVPEYDPYKEEFALEEFQLGQQGLNLQRGQLESQRQLTEDLFGLGQESLQKQIFGAAQSGEQSLYQAFQEGSTIQSAGLGSRSNIANKSKKAIMSQSADQMDILTLQGLEQETKYKSSLDDLSYKLQNLGLQEQSMGMDYRQSVEESQRNYEDDFWEFMTMLKTQFDVGYT